MANKRMRSVLGAAACAAVVTFAVAGCGDLPLAPPLGGSGSGAGSGAELPVLAVAPDGSVAYDSVGTGESLDSLMVDSLHVGTGRGLKVSGEFGLLGGALRASRFALTIPPGALPEPATITMSLPDSTVMLCDLQISPQYLNNFLTPVELSLDTSGLSVKPSELSIYWYDPARERWVDMHPLVDDVGGVLIQPLTHFSTYAGGKAGW